MKHFCRSLTAPIFNSLVAAAFIFASLALTGCKEKGTMEKAGESMDKAIEKTEEKTKEGVKKMGEAAETAGDKIKDATK